MVTVAGGRSQARYCSNLGFDSIANTDFERWTKAHLSKSGDRGRSRTCDPQLRKLMLYPTELHDHVGAS